MKPRKTQDEASCVYIDHGDLFPASCGLETFVEHVSEEMTFAIAELEARNVGCPEFDWIEWPPLHSPAQMERHDHYELSGGAQEEVALAAWELVRTVPWFRLAVKKAPPEELAVAAVVMGRVFERWVTVGPGRIAKLVAAGAGTVAGGRKGARARARPDHGRLVAWARRQLAAGRKPRELASLAIMSGKSTLSVKWTRAVLQDAGLVPKRK